MQLPEELLKKLRLLTDKPISPMVNKELLPLLLHENLNIDKAIQLLCLKYRIDLIIHLVQNGRYPSENVANQMLASIINNILQCKVAEVNQLYILVLTRIDDDKKLLQIGYHDLLKPAIKQPNLQTKQKLFQVIGSNFEYFYKRKCKKVIMAIINNYIEVFTKFLIYVPSYLIVVRVALQIDKSSKKIINQARPQRQPELEQVFIDLSSSEYSGLKTQIVAILENTKEKINYYSLHRNCLVCLKNLCEILNQFKIKDRELFFTEVEVGKIVRTIQIYLDRKGTIDQARFAKAQWMKRMEDLKKIKQSKTQKYINAPIISSPSSLLLDKKQVDSPLLIQQVISMTNNYRLKYQVAPVQQNEDAGQSRILSVSNNYLKKGNGVGGGRTHLLNQKHRSVFQDEKFKMKQLYDGVISKCFAQCDKDIQYKSFVDIKAQQKQPSQVGNEIINQPDLKLESDRKYNKQISQKLKELPPILWDSPNINRNTINNSYLQQSMGSSSAFENDEQVQQISQLIQLAYCYKFS